MKRHIIAQMGNEWRSNLWMVIELLIVSLILWYISAYLLALFHISIPNPGYDFTDVYVGEFRAVPRESPEYIERDSVNGWDTNVDLLLGKIRSNPYVEVVGTGRNAMSYSYNYHGSSLNRALEDTAYWYAGNVRAISPEVPLVIRLQGASGETPEELSAVLEKGQWMIAPLDPAFTSNFHSPELFVGKEDVFFSGDTANVITVGAIARGLKRSDYEPLGRGVIYVPEDQWGSPSQILIRVKPGMGRRFMESLTADDLRMSNIYITNLQSSSDMAEHAHISIHSSMRTFIVCAVFIFLVIFLGFLGTFWFRTQERVSQIAVRKVCGATRPQIFRRLISEGLILLAIATVIAVGIEIALVKTDTLSQWSTVGYVQLNVEAMAITALVLAILIIAGIFFPARKAMNVDAAAALKDQ